jgi:hypothetical protein
MGNDPGNNVDPGGTDTKVSTTASSVPGIPFGEAQMDIRDPIWLAGMGEGWFMGITYTLVLSSNANANDASATGNGAAAEIGAAGGTPSDESPTDVYTPTGQYVGTIPDGSPNIYIINPDKVTQFAMDYMAASLAWMVDINSSAFQSDGVNYDVASYANFYNQYQQYYQATSQQGVSLAPYSDFRFNGQPTLPYAEVNQALVLKNGTLTVGDGPPHTDYDMGLVYPSALTDPNMVSDIHLHPYPGGSFTGQYGQMISPVISKDILSGPSGEPGNPNAAGDMGTSFTPPFWKVMVDQYNVYIYNNMHVITLKR